MKKVFLILFFISFCSILFSQNKICLTSESENLIILPETIKKDFVLSNFLEAYHFRADNSELLNGTYCVYDSKSLIINKLSESNSYLSQLIYISQDSKNYTDLLYISENDYYIPSTDNKIIYGKEYIKFDNKGRLFVSVTKKSTNQCGILMFSPALKTTQFFPLSSDFFTVVDYDISSDGNFIVINADRGQDPYNRQAFIINTEKPSQDAEKLLYMNAHALSNIIYNPETKAFYMLAAYNDTSISDMERAGIIVIRNKENNYSKETLEFVTRGTLSIGTEIDFWHNILVIDETSNKMYGVNYQGPDYSWPGMMYEVIDNQNSVTLEYVKKTKNVGFVDVNPSDYKIALKSTPLGLYIKDKDNNNYLFTDNNLIPCSENEISEKLRNFIEKIYKIRVSDKLKSENILKKEAVYKEKPAANVISDNTDGTNNEKSLNEEISSFSEKVIIANVETVSPTVSEDKMEELENHLQQYKQLILIISIISLLIIFVLTVILVKLLISSRQSYRKELQKKLISLQETDRAKLSRDIHDSVVQDIRAIRLQTELIDVGENAEACLQKKRVIDDITQTIKKMRNICYNLTPAELVTHQKDDSAQIELVSVIDSLCQQFYVKSKIPCSIQIAENLIYPSFDKEKTLNLVRIFQEILSNIEKHSYATNVNVMIRNKTEDDKNYLVIFVIDDGIGCNLEQTLKNRKRNHFGINNMKERMNLVGGTIDFFSSENQGMKIKLTVNI